MDSDEEEEEEVLITRSGMVCQPGSSSHSHTDCSVGQYRRDGKPGDFDLRNECILMSLRAGNLGDRFS